MSRLACASRRARPAHLEPRGVARCSMGRIALFDARGRKLVVQMVDGMTQEKRLEVYVRGARCLHARGRELRVRRDLCWV